MITDINTLREFFEDSCNCIQEETISADWVLRAIMGFDPAIRHIGESKEGKGVKMEMKMNVNAVMNKNFQSSEFILGKLMIAMNSYKQRTSATYVHITSDFHIAAKLDTERPDILLICVTFRADRDGLMIESKKK